jgi:hypothetical protein
MDSKTKNIFLQGNIEMEFEDQSLREEIYSSRLYLELHKFNGDPDAYFDMIEQQLIQIRQVQMSLRDVDIAINRWERFDIDTLRIMGRSKFTIADFVKRESTIIGEPSYITPYLRVGSSNVHIDNYTNKQQKMSWSKAVRNAIHEKYDSQAKIKVEAFLLTIPKMIRDYLKL